MSDEVITTERDDWETFDKDNMVVTVKEQDMQDQKPLSAGIKQMLYEDMPVPARTRRVFDVEEMPTYESIYELASANNQTVEQYVYEDPEKAVRMMEYTYAQWNNLLTMAAIKGAITLKDEVGDEHDYTVNKNQVALIEMRLGEVKDQLAQVRELALTCPSAGDKRKDALERSMYKRALNGDSRLAIYLHDRVEGRPMEAVAVEFDYDNTYNVYKIIHAMFDKQLEVLNAGNGTILICCSRRAGKTDMLCSILLVECLSKPRTRVMYIGETMELSESLVGKAMDDIIDRCDLKDKKGKRLNWRKLDNGSVIMIRGLSNTKDPDQIRGQAAKIIVIDEFFHLKSELLEYMQREVLEPMQLDYADGYKFICAGTPPKIKGTYGEMVWKTWEVPHFQWTWRDNPHPVALDARTEYVEKILKDKGLDWSSSFARREYNGEWAYDDDLLLYPEIVTYDAKESMPSIMPTRILFGIDYGVSDNDTIWGCVWNDDEKRGYQFWETKFNRLDIIDKSISQLEYLCSQIKIAWQTAMDYFPDLTPKEANKRILWDADDNDQHLTDYANVNVKLDGTDYAGIHLNITNAHKTDRAIMYDLIRDNLRTGNMLLIKGSKTEHECTSTVLKRGPNGEIYKEIDNKVFHPDLLPAMRYALWNAFGN